MIKNMFFKFDSISPFFFNKNVRPRASTSCAIFHGLLHFFSKLRRRRSRESSRGSPLGKSGWHQLQYLWRKRGGYPLSPARGAPRTGGCAVGGLIPISRRIISAEARPTAALLPPCGDKRVGGALFNYGGIGRGPAVGVADQGGPGLDLLPTFNNISAQPSSPLQPHPHRKRAK